jgi:cyclase
MLSFRHLADNLIMARTPSALLNATIFFTHDACFVIDTMLTASDSRQLLDNALSHGKGNLFVINTHWHSDHCFGNRYFKLYDARMIAHESHYQTLFDERRMLNSGKSVMLDKQLVPEPDYTFSSHCLIENDLINPDDHYPTGGNPLLKISHAPGHTYDNSYVFIPSLGVVITGDNVLNGDQDKYALPYFFWGDDELLLKSLKSILTLKPELIIPGHGDPVSRDKIKTDIHYVEALQEKVKEIISAGSYSSLEDLKLLLAQSIRVADCLPNLTAEQVWVVKVHTLNLNLLAVKYYTQVLD